MSVVYLSPKLIQLNQQKRLEKNSSTVQAGSLVTKRRLDLTIKRRLFLHLSSGDKENSAKSLELYTWLIDKRNGPRMVVGLKTDRWKETISDYASSASRLMTSMSSYGFDATKPIPIDPDGELLDGSHRLSCAIALGIDKVPVDFKANYVWAPRWDADWFRYNGASDATISILESELEEMKMAGKIDATKN